MLLATVHLSKDVFDPYYALIQEPAESMLQNLALAKLCKMCGGRPPHLGKGARCALPLHPSGLEVIGSSYSEDTEAALSLKPTYRRTIKAKMKLAYGIKN